MGTIDELERVCEESAQRIREAKGQYVRREASRKGGLVVSQDRAHMSEIGRKGGQKVSADRAHMSAIGRLGGARERVARESQNEQPRDDAGTPGEGAGGGGQ